MPNYSIKSPENKEEWDSYLLFRWEVLRKPLGMSKDSLADSIEDESFHLMGIDEEKNVIASGRVHFNSKNEAQIRYMAVDENFKRKGVGTEIVKELENYAISKGIVNMILNARENAISFYLSLGYEEVGPYQSDTGIPHKTMKKSLVS
ncbi:MAG: GNAT family N-acetyltransferase [Gammaproteobacteria bacterium]|nr:histone acetyltransferase [Gammaproteobacteria bacterium]RZP03130.1 MAG: GNAT family N-acetyltransferase [Gammaproteobacteria bacterium]|tara:strand:- start:732 stop:1175 length:444 start_codon:yes stop_codon:yes gene_type:complete